MEKDFSFLDDLQVIAEEDILDSGLDRERIWLVQNSEGAILGPYMEDDLRRIAHEYGRALNFCNACRLSDRQWKLFFDHPQFQRRIETPFPPLLPRNQENFEEFFVLHQGQKHGPYAPEAIQQMLIKKILNMQGLISADKGKTWKKVYHFEIFDRRREGKYSIPDPVKSQTLNNMNNGPTKGQENSVRPPHTNGHPLAEELTSTLLLGQKHMPPRSAKSVQNQLQKEFNNLDFTSTNIVRYDFWQKISDEVKKQWKTISAVIGLFLFMIFGRLLYPTQLPPSINHPNPNPNPNPDTNSDDRSIDRIPQNSSWSKKPINDIKASSVIDTPIFSPPEPVVESPPPKPPEAVDPYPDENVDIVSDDSDGDPVDRPPTEPTPKARFRVGDGTDKDSSVKVIENTEPTGGDLPPDDEGDVEDP